MNFNHEITPRIPDVAWEQIKNLSIWYSNKRVNSHIMNAYSFVFPQGESFFVDNVREAFECNKHKLSPELHQEVEGFCKQENLHSTIHLRYNNKLIAEGYNNSVKEYLDKTREFSEKNLSLMSRLAIVAAYEHFTAIMGGFLLKNYHILAKSNPDVALIWGWHALEESEHKAVCYDLYQECGGGWLRRVCAYFFVTINFNIIFMRSFLGLIAKDGCLKPWNLPKTIFDFLWFFYRYNGVGWYVFMHYFQYFLPNFHPWNFNNKNDMVMWLKKYQSKLKY